MKITITLTLPEAQVLRHTLIQCLHLAQRSPNIASALGISPEMRSQAARIAESIKMQNAGSEK